MAKRTKADDPGATTSAEEAASVTVENTPPDSTFTGASTDTSSGGAVSGVVDSAKQAADQVMGQAATRAEKQRQTVASGLAAVGDAFRRMGDGLRDQDQGPVAQYAAEIGQAMGDQVGRIAQYLRGRDVRQIVNDAEDFARRRPGVFLGGAFVLGLAASRFLKSSRPAQDVSANMPNPNRALPPAPVGGLGMSSAKGTTGGTGLTGGTGTIAREGTTDTPSNSSPGGTPEPTTAI
jgi:hypothetical protein